jgi:hypothetical protein
MRRRSYHRLDKTLIASGTEELRGQGDASSITLVTEVTLSLSLS